MLGAIAQFETERQIDGIQKAKARGMQFGAQRKLTDEQVVKLKRRRKSGKFILLRICYYRHKL